MIYRDRRLNVPLRKGISVSRTGDRRIVYYPPMSTYGEAGKNRCPITIGYLCNDSGTMMHPNDNFRDLFPGEWEKQFHEKVPPLSLKMGMYTIFKAVDKKCGVLGMVDKAFGSYSAAIKDYALHGIINQTFVTAHIEEQLHDYVLFSGNTLSDSTYSNLFNKNLKRSMILEFKKDWIEWCKQNGADKVYLCIDGSNNPCESVGVDINEKGHAKILKNKDIVSFTYAVTPDGLPVTYELYRGGMVDSGALKRIIDFLTECGIQVRGVILDRGYCDGTVMKYLDDLHIEYLIMVKGKPTGIHRLREEGVELIRWRAEYWLPHTQMFATQQQVQLFEKFKKIDNMTTFFEHTNASGELKALLDKLSNEMSRAENRLSQGKDPAIKSEYSKVLYVKDNQVCINDEELQALIDSKGLFSIVHSEALTPKEVNDLYDARDVCETLYMILKTQLGFYVTRMHLTMGVHSKFFVAFLCLIIRYFIRMACQGTGKDTMGMIREMDLLEMERINNLFYFKETAMGRQKVFLKNLGCDESIIHDIVKEINDRIENILPVPRRRKRGRKKGEHLAPIDDNGNVQRRKPGVKPGTIRPPLKKDGTPRCKPGPKPGVKRGVFNADGSPRKKPGPKPGSHHKKQ